MKLLKSVNPHKAGGADGISNCVLKYIAESIYRPITKLFNTSLNLGIVPSEWKMSHVCPIFKKGNKHDKANYRPISLLSTISKALEKIVFKHMYEHLISNNLLIKENSGFKRNDSTVNQLMSVTHKIYKSIDEGTDVCCVFLDVSKAFDKVWHEGLFFKIQQLGIHGRLMDWLKNYLKDRHQRVVLNGKTSSAQRVTAGVPQGSILGPLLFLIFVNDINTNINCNISLFADDTSIYTNLENRHSITRINNDLETLNKWSKQWIVSFNALKTEYLIISTKPIRVNYPPQY